MFTGIIESLGTITAIDKKGTNITFFVKSDISKELKVDQSVSHDGVCLTVESVNSGVHQVTAIEETLLKSNLSDWVPGTAINMERCMLNNGRFDGHIVQGHVDTVGEIVSVVEKDGSWVFTVKHDPKGHITVEKGSVTVNGISLTCFDCEEGKFSIAIIPYTFEHTNLHNKKAGDRVNLEFDIIGKYVQKLLTINK